LQGTDIVGLTSVKLVLFAADDGVLGQICVSFGLNFSLNVIVSPAHVHGVHDFAGTDLHLSVLVVFGGVLVLSLC
jgi:hypothetical protein